MTQLFDYFVVVGLVPLPPSPDQNDEDDEQITFVPSVIDRYPLKDQVERCGYELPPTLPFFCMPEGKLRTPPSSTTVGAVDHLTFLDYILCHQLSLSVTL